MKNISSKQLEVKKFITMLCVIVTATFVICYQDIVRSYNSTLIALSYKYGFTSRSLLGTIYHFFDEILPINMIQYDMVLLFAQICTILFFVFVIIFCYLCIKNCNEESIKPCEYLMLFLTVFLVSTFSAGYNFFRVDIFMIWISLTAVLLIVFGKAEWLVVPLSLIGVMFHQGYVFMYFNVILILFICKFFDAKEDKGRWKYGVLFAGSFLIASVAFLWFEFFSRSNGHLYYETIIEEARNLANEGLYHSTLLKHEVLGIDLSESEQRFRKVNFVQLPLFTMLLAPYVVVAFRFFKNLIKKAENVWQRCKYIFVAIGSLTLLPNFILKIDYGRWVMSAMFYYVVVIIGLLVMKDEHVEREVLRAYEGLKQKPWVFVFVLYTVFFMPLCDVDINTFMQTFADQIDEWFLHIY